MGILPAPARPRPEHLPPVVAKHLVRKVQRPVRAPERLAHGLLRLAPRDSGRFAQRQQWCIVVATITDRDDRRPVQLRLCPGHLGVVPLAPRGPPAVAAEPGVRVEIGAAHEPDDASRADVDADDVVLDVLGPRLGVVLLNGEDPVRRRGVGDAEVAVPQPRRAAAQDGDAARVDVQQLERVAVFAVREEDARTRAAGEHLVGAAAVLVDRSADAVGVREDVAELVRAVGALGDLDDGARAAGLGFKVEYPACQGLCVLFFVFFLPC